MQKMRKFLSLMLVVVFALAMMAPTTSAASFGDVPESYRYYNAVENLAARGIINGMGDGNYAPDANVKRDEFAKIVCTGILNSGEVAPTAGAGFTDVAADRWSSGYIKVAAAAGIINGMGDGTFAPENPVTYEQAIKMFVCALGYGEQALKRGEYPGGYLSQAQALGLTKGVVDGVQGQPANRGLIAKLVDNSLTVEIYDELTGTTTGSLEDNDTLKTVKGQVIAVHGQAIYSDGDIRELPNRNQIVIERGSQQEVYSIENANIDNPADYLGKMVTVYYEEDHEVDYYEITRITLQEHKNKITKIDLGLLEDYTNTRVEYLPKEDADYETATVDGDAIIMVNGLLSAQTLTQVLDANLTKSGEIQLLDTTGNGSASIVFVKLYDTFIINSKIDSEYKIYDRISGASEVLNPKDRAKKITIVKDGREIAFSNLMINDVLSIAKSADGKIIEVLVSSKGTISGMISEVSDDASILVINNKEYKVSKSYLTEAQTKLTNDVSATFYLDAFGKIAYATNIGATNASEWKYGYLLGLQDGGSTSEELKVRLYNINGSSYTSPVTYDVDLAGGVKINGETKKTVAAVKTALLESAKKFNDSTVALPSNKEYTQVIKYMLDGNVIDRIAVYSGTNDYENASVLNVDNVGAANESTPTTLKATSTNKLGKYSTASAKSIVIPSDRIDGDYKTFGYYTVDTNYKAQIIDASTINQAKVVVFYSLTSVQADIVGETPMIVTSVTGRASVDGEALRTLKAIDMNGTEKVFYSDGTETYTTLASFTSDSLTGDTTFRNIAVGDIIKVTADNKAILEEVMLIAKATSIANGTQSFVTKAEGNNGASYTAQYRYMLGTARIVDKTNGNNLVIAPMYYTDGSFADETTDETYTSISGANVFVVNTAETNEDRIVKTGVFDDILGASKVAAAEASKLFVYQSYGAIKMIVVVR